MTMVTRIRITNKKLIKMIIIKTKIKTANSSNDINKNNDINTTRIIIIIIKTVMMMTNIHND